MNEFWDTRNSIVEKNREAAPALVMAYRSEFNYTALKSLVNGDPFGFTQIEERAAQDADAVEQEWKIILDASSAKALLCLRLSAERIGDLLDRHQMVKAYSVQGDPDLENAAVADLKLSEDALSGLIKGISPLQHLAGVGYPLEEGLLSAQFEGLSEKHRKIMYTKGSRKAQDTGLSTGLRIKALEVCGQEISEKMLAYASEQSYLGHLCLRGVFFDAHFISKNAKNPGQTHLNWGSLLGGVISSFRGSVDATRYAESLRRSVANMKSMNRPFFMQP